MAQSGIIENGGFARGTHIATPGGAVAVEDLRAGDQVMTELGPARLLECAPAGTAPAGVLIRAGALGPGCPARDIALAAQHLIFLREPTAAQGALAPAAALVNGNTVLRATEPAERAWFIPRLETPALLLAENLALAAHRAEGMAPCAPTVPPGPALFALRRRVVQGEVVSALPPPPKPDADLLLLADSARVRAEAEDPWRFTIPPGARALHLASPVGVLADAADSRQFGVAITAIRLDGIPLDLAGPIAGAGFHPPEAGWRWTDGRAELRLPPSAHPRRLEVWITDWHHTLRRDV